MNSYERPYYRVYFTNNASKREFHANLCGKVSADAYAAMLQRSPDTYSNVRVKRIDPK